MKRKPLLLILSLLMITAVALAGCDTLTPTGGTTSEDIGQQATGIWVSGTGEVTVTPDIAILETGVEAQEATVTAAQEMATEAMDDVTEALTDGGVREEDIQTSYYRIREQTRWDEASGQETVTGYQVTIDVTAKIRNIDEVGSIIDAVVRAGGDLVRIDNLYFSVDDPTIYYDEAREAAMADAKAKAEKLASQAKVKLGNPTYIAESTATPYAYQSYSYSGGMAVPAPTVEVSVSPGEVEVSLTVQVAYGIK
jgi:uncharacterized protein YggE